MRSAMIRILGLLAVLPRFLANGLERAVRPSDIRDSLADDAVDSFVDSLVERATHRVLAPKRVGMDNMALGKPGRIALPPQPNRQCAATGIVTYMDVLVDCGDSVHRELVSSAAARRLAGTKGKAKANDKAPSTTTAGDDEAKPEDAAEATQPIGEPESDEEAEVQPGKATGNGTQQKKKSKKNANKTHVPHKRGSQIKKEKLRNASEAGGNVTTEAPNATAPKGKSKAKGAQNATKASKNKTASDPAAPSNTTTTTSKGKRNKTNTTRRGKPRLVLRVDEGQNNSVFVGLGNWKGGNNTTQTLKSDIPIHRQFDRFPRGEEVFYLNADADQREKKKEAEKVMRTEYENIRHAAECHRQVRRYAQSFIRPGMTMIEICKRLEAKTHELINASGLDRGWGFPTGCSLNHVAAHYTPNYGDKVVLEYDDICKLDFGVQVGGRIVDCASTIAFNPKFEPLVEASREATYEGIKQAGIDARFTDIGAAIGEVIESYEITLDGKTYKIRPVRNLNGHTMEKYRIHAGKSVPITKNDDPTKMEEGEFYAIETFASTGKGRVVEEGECSHFMKVFDAKRVPLRDSGAKKLLAHIEKHFGTLAFCRRWLDDQGQTEHLLPLKQLVQSGIIEDFPPLCDVKGSYTSQFEHTIMLRPTCKEIVTKGDDY